MDRIRFGVTGKFGVVLATLCVLHVGSDASAQGASRKVYNPVTGRTEIEQRPQSAAPTQARPVRQAALIEGDMAESAVQPANCQMATCDGNCGDPTCGVVDYGTGYCGESIGNDGLCGETICGDTIGCGNTVACRPRRLYAGFEFTFVKPRFGNNVAFTVTDSDGVGNETISDTDFDYDLELTPRVYVGWGNDSEVGLRATWWQFDHEAATASADFPASGFGSVSPPDEFGTVDISASQLGERNEADTSLDAYTIDIEATKQTSFCGWDLGVAGGLRYAYTEQRYQSRLLNTSDELLGNINFTHSNEGIGPTISLSMARPLTRRLSLYSKARGSVLFGDGESRLDAEEDSNLSTAFTTTRNSSRDDLLSIAEIQLGFQWQGDRRRDRVFTPFLAAAMEGQVWNGVGNATSEEGDLGFFGFTANVGCDW